MPASHRPAPPPRGARAPGPGGAARQRLLGAGGRPHRLQERQTDQPPGSPAGPDATGARFAPCFAGASVTASGYEATAAARPTGTAARANRRCPSNGRATNAGWSWTARPTTCGLRCATWQENGFLLTLDQPQLGLMETDWAENRAKIRKDIIRSTIGKLFDNLYSTGERDKFRTRVGSATPQAAAKSSSATAAWSRSTPPSAKTTPSGRPAPPTRKQRGRVSAPPRVVQAGREPGAVQGRRRGGRAAGDRAHRNGRWPADGRHRRSFDRAWRRVGLALDRSGFTVEDRNRAEDILRALCAAGRRSADARARLPGPHHRLVWQFQRGAKRADALPHPRHRHRRACHGGRAGQQRPAGPSATAQRIAQLIANDMK